MKQNNFTYIILEGSDGVGKTSILPHLYELFNRRYIIEDRGDISEYVYATKYNRPMRKYSHNMSALYVILRRNEDELLRNIRSRTTHDALGDRITTEEEEKKIADQALFVNAYTKLQDEYAMVLVDISELTVEQSAKKVANAIKQYISEIPHDAHMNSFNLMYEKGCAKFGLQWYTIDNQPYLENQMIMADFQYHNGMFETYDDKTIPHNLLFSAAYENTEICTIDEFKAKTVDFQYPINSKILFRPEVYKYAETMTNKHTMLTTESGMLKLDNLQTFPKTFGDDYIKYLSKAKATVYTSRELEPIEMMTVRCYEAVLANNVIFVDWKTDPNSKILHQIYGNDQEMIDLLNVTEFNLAERYEQVMKDDKLIMKILTAQHAWYNRLLGEINVNKIKQVVK